VGAPSTDRPRVAQPSDPRHTDHDAVGRLAVVFGGIIPRADVEKLRSLGIRRVYPPADYDLLDIMDSFVDVIAAVDR
jgi:methylmalonyl-CoA mutase cobalamin-binding subunit